MDVVTVNRTDLYAMRNALNTALKAFDVVEHSSSSSWMKKKIAIEQAQLALAARRQWLDEKLKHIPSDDGGDHA